MQKEKMMQPILETLARHLVRSASSELGQLRIILPNRRAGLFLQRHLANHVTQISWTPHIYTISDFIDEQSLLGLADPLDLFFRLYDIYRKYVEIPESMDEFYLWGEMMLRDFDELDKYLVDADMLFRNIIDLKELEEPLAGLDPEQLEFIRQFWTGFHTGERTREKEQFISSWVLLPQLYKDLRFMLTEKGQAYQGMQYREIAERTLRGEVDYRWKGRTIVVGFNALNRCEKLIFSALHKQGAEFYWDYDHQYIDSPGKEAGRFLRDNMDQYPPAAELEDFSGLEDGKRYNIFELPTDVLQAKMVHRILEDKDAGTLHECTDTALVLCDEDLLLPVLMSLPGNISDINVTMGYPMKNTSVYSFIDTLLRMQHNIRQGSGGSVRFYHKDVIAILLHPYFRNLKEEATEDLTLRILQENLVTVEQVLFTGKLEQSIFRPVKGAADMLEYLKILFNQILETLGGKEELMQDALDRAFIFHLLTHLNKLETLVARRTDIGTGILDRLLRKQLGTLRMPFEGEPLSGLQLMGILETRLLDFNHVILLSMNEEVMPGTPSIQSTIPYSLRLAFSMPAKEDKDAIYAYYFYRLLQRARRVDLLFNGGSEGLRTGEKSRYLHQLIFKHNLEVRRPGLEVRARESTSLEIPHSEVVELKLKQFRSNAEEGRKLSPSAVNTYIDCSLKFYLKYIAGIGEADEVSEDIDPAGFGTVVHDTLNELYSGIADRNGGLMGREDLSQLLVSSLPEEALKKQFMKQHFKGRTREELEGRNIIIFRVMLRYLIKIIRTDLAIAPFTLVSAEDNYQRKLQIEVAGENLEICLGGKIDRVDMVGGLIRVIDYKTGQTSQKFTSLESLFQSDYGSRNGAAMQILFYSWLVGEAYPGEEVMPGLYGMKGLFGEEFDPALNMTSQRNEGRIETFRKLEEPFLHLLKEVLQKLFDPQVPFVQRKEDQKCSYCDFAALCHRKYKD
jgi:hypothetical protein